jgi:hypothetical protein
LHLVLLLALGLFVLEAPVRTAPLLLYATFAEFDRAEETPAVRMESPQSLNESEPERLREPELASEQQTEQAALEPAPFESAELAGYLDAKLRSAEPVPPLNPPVSHSQPPLAQTASDGGRSEPVAEPKPIPVPSHATTSGRFTAWTEPPCPRPGQSYRIIVLVRLPERIQRYYSSDLTGMVIGSDGYRKYIRGSSQEALPLTNHTARLVIPVVGSDRGFKDTVVVQSRILRERRVLELVYSRAARPPSTAFAG